LIIEIESNVEASISMARISVFLSGVDGIGVLAT
jgi:hypothetical protein